MDCQPAGRFRRGEMVRVRSPREILGTLAADGTLEGLPFMPEMQKYCGGTFEVFRRTEKICVEGGGIRRVKDAVFLRGLRCDGSFHQGCDRRCLIFWKEAWLRPLEASPPSGHSAGREEISQEIKPATEKDGRFWCQSTELLAASIPLPWWDLRQYPRELALRETTVGQLLGQMGIPLGYRLRRRLRRVIAPAPTAPQATGMDAALNLQKGELVEVKSLREIEATLDSRQHNRGLEFTPDMAQYCRRKFRVAGRVEKIVLEQTGEMRDLSDTVLLDGLVCNGVCGRGCVRSNYHYWREAWLRRVAHPSPE